MPKIAGKHELFNIKACRKVYCISWYSLQFLCISLCRSFLKSMSYPIIELAEKLMTMRTHMSNILYTLENFPKLCNVSVPSWETGSQSLRKQGSAEGRFCTACCWQGCWCMRPGCALTSTAEWHSPYNKKGPMQAPPSCLIGDLELISPSCINSIFGLMVLQWTLW